MSVEPSSVGLPDPEAIFASAGIPVDIELEPFGVVTTTDEVRAVFGLSPAELSDEMLTQPIYTGEIKELLLRIRPELFTRWDSLQNERLLELVKRVALYSICSSVSDVLPLVAARTLTDSKASFQRYNTDLNTMINTIRNRLNQAIRALQDTKKSTRVPRFLSSARPSYDPVTD